MLSFIQAHLAAGTLTRDDLLSLIGTPVAAHAPVAAQPAAAKEASSWNLIHTFYGIGAIIALIGVAILVAQNWNELGFIGRLLVTLGISLATYAGGISLARPDQRMLSQVLFTISGVLAPLGAYVLVSEAGVNFDANVQAITGGILAVIFGTALYVSRRTILALLTVGFVTWAYYAFIFKIIGFEFYEADLMKWATMLLGASYILIAYGWRSVPSSTDSSIEKEKRAALNVLYGFGTLAILGMGITIGGGFDIFYIALIFAAFYGSVYLKSRPMLIFAGLFLMAHLIKLTSEYFVDSIGWSVALIVAGFMVIGVGYLTFYLNKKFLSVA